MTTSRKIKQYFFPRKICSKRALVALAESEPGLPDGLLSYQKSLFVCILEGLRMENVGIHILLPFTIVDHFIYSRLNGICYGHLVHSMVIWNIRSRFGMK
jgi:hypothetical protein